jgi:hypothetical protein
LDFLDNMKQQIFSLGFNHVKEMKEPTPRGIKGEL